MAVSRFGWVLAACFLYSCAWVLPKPSAGKADAVAAGSQAECRLDLAEARQAAVDRVDAVGAAVPSIVVLADGPNEDRVIRNDSRVMLRSISGVADRRPTRGTETAPMTIVSVGGVAFDPVEIRGESVIRLQAGGAGPLAPGAGAKPTPTATAAREFVVYKADVPDPNRPSSCDSILRDGDFVYLRTLAPSAWVTVYDGTLAPAADAGPRRTRCGAPQQQCYTDRYGGLVCARFRTCVGAPSE